MLDKGEVSAESVIVFPVILSVVLIAIQAGIFMHGANAANHIASQGALAAAGLRVGHAQAIRVVESAADSVGARLASAPEISISGAEVSAQVTVVIPRAVPFFPEMVTRRVTVPRERYVSFLDR